MVALRPAVPVTPMLAFSATVIVLVRVFVMVMPSMWNLAEFILDCASFGIATKSLESVKPGCFETLLIQYLHQGHNQNGDADETN